eukprot:COSAG01_NODE_145_length_24103_cov_41.178012_18_plen_133_part_00
MQATAKAAAAAVEKRKSVAAALPSAGGGSGDGGGGFAGLTSPSKRPIEAETAAAGGDTKKARTTAGSLKAIPVQPRAAPPGSQGTGLPAQPSPAGSANGKSAALLSFLERKEKKGALNAQQKLQLQKLREAA